MDRQRQMDKVIFVPCVEKKITYEFWYRQLIESQKVEISARTLSNSDHAVYTHSQAENTAFTV